MILSHILDVGSILMKRIKSVENECWINKQRWVIDEKILPIRIAIQFTLELKTELQFQLPFSLIFLNSIPIPISWINSLFNSLLDKAKQLILLFPNTSNQQLARPFRFFWIPMLIWTHCTLENGFWRLLQ